MEEKFPEAYQAFKNQKDRFELKECHLYYNGQLVPLYDTLYITRKLFGDKYDKNLGYDYYNIPISINIDYFNQFELSRTQEWQNGQRPKETNFNMRLKSLRVYFHHKKSDIYNPNAKISDSLDALIPTTQYMLVEGYPVDKYTDFDKLNAYLEKIGSAPFEEYGWRKGGVPTREYAYGSNKCATDLMNKFVVNGKLRDLEGNMFISFSYSVIDGKKTILYFSYE